MYVAPYFQMTDADKVLDFIKSNPFGILVASQSNIPLASHIPFWLEERDGSYFLTGHLSIANELASVLEKVDQVLVIFQGSHGYISPSWYEKQNVPTWNYQAVHIYGSAALLSGPELEAHVKELMDSYESNIPGGRKYEDMTADYREKELRGIKGFRIKIENVEAAYKLSQNRNEKDHANIIEQLKKSANPHDHELAKLMEENRPTQKQKAGL
ncbi:FMN-binding negative transcriptional regulator [uncultured Imperialibacter sp.]|uniref:FMN-binding negative transcriptional regulator n=1 Tax=uncultured Imperialibacter sp. TaxID=1672639 RepID=UPI0030D82A01|tara:strand:+ start:6954 stop:7592 length:639 start_codon:yes stop_codon:yes gene_type:complete